MIVFLLLIFWVQQPLSFSRSWRRALITTAILLAAIIPTGILGPSSGIDASNVTAQDNLGAPRDRSINGVSTKPARRLREGTLVPKTTGRIAMIGRRWMFISQPDQFEGMNATAAATSPTQNSDDAIQGSFFANGLLNQTTSLTYTQATADRRSSDAQDLPNVLIVENLMLQRIVEAIREYSQDDQWQITGVVTEFFDENRLVILSAKRAADRNDL